MSPRVTVPAPPSVRWIVRRLEENGFDTWAVGGAVRDALAGHPIGDWDLATAARPTDMRRIFRRTVPVGIEHGTVGVLDREGRMYEVTTFRKDVETDGRHARVLFADRIEDDLARRDFTINAVAWHPLRDELRDPYDGARDLAAGVLRTVGPAAERFREDYLRVLRCFRFAGRFGLEIDAETWAAARRSADHLTRLSGERIREELYKSLSLRRGAGRVLNLYRRSGALGVLYPEVMERRGVDETANDGPGWRRTVRAVEAVAPGSVLVRVAAFLADPCATATDARRVAGAAHAVMTRLRTSNAERDRVVHLVARTATVPPPDASSAELRRWLHGTGREYLYDAFRLHAALVRGRQDDPADAVRLWRGLRSELRNDPPLTIGELAIGGKELRELGLRPGPAYGEILAGLLDRALEDPGVNTKERLLEIVEREWLRDEE